MNADLSYNRDFNANFSLHSQKEPVVVGKPLNYAKRMVRLVSIKESHQVSDRVGWSDVELTVVAGHCEIRSGGKIEKLTGQESTTVPAMVEHSIHAVTDVRIVVSFQLGCPAEVQESTD